MPNRARSVWAAANVAGAAVMALVLTPALSIKPVLGAELVPRRALFGLPARTNAQLSATGTQVSFLAPSDGGQNIWVGPVNDVSAARPVTHDAGRAIKNYVWSFDSGIILYWRDVGGDENFHIHALDVATGTSRDLTPFDKIHAMLISGSDRHPDEYLIGINDRDARWIDVWRINIQTGERSLVELNDRFASYVADRDLKVRLAVEALPGGALQVYKRDGRNAWIPFFLIPAEDAKVSTPLSFSADGRSVYVVDSTGRDTAALVSVDYDSAARTIVAQDPRSDLKTFFFDSRSNAPLGYRVDYLESHWRPVGPSIQSDLQRLEHQLSGTIDIVSQSADGNQWIVCNESPQRPLEYYFWDHTAKRLKPLFATRPELARYRFRPTHGVEIRSRDGLVLPTYLTLPADTASAAHHPYPVVLDVHGGPWFRTPYGFDALTQWLANRGYAVLNVNFRGSKGFGKAFLNAGNRQWGAAMHDDLIDAVRWAIAHGIADPDKVAILGGSYGGYSTLVGLTFTPTQFACGVDEVGPTELVTLLTHVPAYWAPDLESLALRVGDWRTEEGREFLKSRSPLYRADQIVRPLLIGVGANDPRVTPVQTDQIVAAMQAHQQPVTQIVYPDEGHWFERTDNRNSFNAVTEQFLAKCLGGRAEPFGDALSGSSTQVKAGAQFVPGLEAALKARLEDHPDKENDKDPR